MDSFYDVGAIDARCQYPMVKGGRRKRTLSSLVNAPSALLAHTSCDDLSLCPVPFPGFVGVRQRPGTLSQSGCDDDMALGEMLRPIHPCVLRYSTGFDFHREENKALYCQCFVEVTVIVVL